MAARAFLSGMDPYASVNDLALRFLGMSSAFPLPTPHPPTAILLFWPLGLLSYSEALTCWLGLSLSLLVLSVSLLARCFGARLHLLLAAAAAVMLVAWYPFMSDLASGQLNIPMLALGTGALFALQRARPGLAGVLIGLAVILKLIFWPFALLFLARRQWRPLAAVAGTAVAGWTIAGIVLGPPMLVFYFRDVLPEVDALYGGAVNNTSIWTVGTRLFSGTGSPAFPGLAVPPLAASSQLAAVSSIALPLILVFGACWLARRISLEGGFALFAVVGVLVSPLAWDHYLVLLVIPLAYVVRRLASTRFPSRETNAALLVGSLLSLAPENWLALATLLGGRPSGSGVTLPFGLALLSLMPTVAMLALGALVVWLDRTSSAGGSL